LLQRRGVRQGAIVFMFTAMSVNLSNSNSVQVEDISVRLPLLAEKAVLARQIWSSTPNVSISTDTADWKQICWTLAKEAKPFEIEFGMSAAGRFDYPFVNSLCEAYRYAMKLTATRLVLKPQ
jgi:hypothetical protein